MAKKKSKSQKQRKNLKKKRKTVAQVKGYVSTKDDVLYNVALTNPDIFKDVVSKQNKKNSISSKEKGSKDHKGKKSLLIIKNKPKVKEKKVDKIRTTEKKKVIKIEKNNKYTTVNDIVSLVFNCILLLTFIILLIGVLRVDVFTKKEILWGVCLLGFLILIALSYNKYISGKIFTIMLVSGMIFGIYKLQYTYDFFHNLNTIKYEYKKYYLVGFDIPQNVNVYSINGKKVGLLTDNYKHVQRKVNTIVDDVNYMLYENEDVLFNSLYNSDVRALLLTENEYKYLQIDSKFHSEKNLKVLYEFKINAPK